MKRYACTFAFVLFLVLSGHLCAAAAPMDRAVEAVATEFDRNQIVALGEPHFSVPFHAFLAELLKSPKFTRYAPDIVVEFGNAKYQAVADRYVYGGQVPEANLRKIWRDTTQFLVWDSPLYRRFFVEVREQNARLPRGHKIRVLLGDPPVDWAHVRKSADFPHDFGYRDWFYADIVEKLAIAKHHRALLVMGSAHLTHFDVNGDFRTQPRLKSSVGAILTAEMHKPPFIIWPYFGNVDGPVPELVPVAASSFRDRSFQVLMPDVVFFHLVRGVPQTYTPPPQAWPQARTMIDALLVLGKNDIASKPRVSDFDPAYIVELRRRAAILDGVFGPGYEQQLEALLQGR